MADRTLAVTDLWKLLERHGCIVRLENNYLKVRRGDRGWTQHAHKGRRDKFDRRIVGLGRRRLGFGDMSDEDFYAPLD